MGALIRLALLLMVLLAAGLLGVRVGSTPIPFREFFSEEWAVIVREVRLPRVILAILVGGGLAAAGAAYQGLFRNPLADPFLIGTSSGASLGAIVVRLAGLTGTWLGMGAVPGGAFLGSLLASVLVFVTGTAGRTWQLARLLLAGAAVGTMLNALSWILLMRQGEDIAYIIGSLLGSLNNRGWTDIAAVWPWLAIGLTGLMLCARTLDALALGEDAARGLGLPVRRAVAVVMMCAGLLTAASVSAGGVIGFLGLVAPYLARPFVGHRHVVLIPASALIGASLLILSDMIARLAVAPSELPVGVVTALLAGPFFLAVLAKGRP